jgi:hypothetical protein
MSAPSQGWMWDSVRQAYYYYHAAEHVFIYQNGGRLPAPQQGVTNSPTNAECASPFPSVPAYADLVTHARNSQAPRYSGPAHTRVDSGSGEPYVASGRSESSDSTGVEQITAGIQYSSLDAAANSGMRLIPAFCGSPCSPRMFALSSSLERCGRGEWAACNPWF